MNTKPTPAKPRYKRNKGNNISIIDNLPTRLDQKLIVVACALVACDIAVLMLAWIR